MKKIIIALTFLCPLLSFGQNAIYTTKVAGACDMCKDRIEKAAINTIGVNKAVWNSETQLLEVSHDNFLFNQMELHRNISKVGHDTEKLKADDEVYAALPTCCHYREGAEVNHNHEDGTKLINNTIEEVAGVIYEKNASGNKIAIIGANIYWLGGTAGTVSKSNGSFNLPMQAPYNKLVIEYVGFASDTVLIEKPGTIEVVLSEGIELDEVKVRARRRSIEISYISPIKLRRISQKELTKAACCNLSESFETNPAVDVSYTDAITGTKQIEMLGLAGPYVQITRENMPDVRGLASIYGLGFIPGPWIESIQLNLGSGSVINGFESIAGQINVELKKPGDKEKLFVNGYYGGGGRIETNVNATTEVNDHFDTNILFHYNTRSLAHDQNFDGFLDMPKGNGWSFSNNWRYYGENGNEGQFGFKVTGSDNTAGQDEKHHTGMHPPGFELWKANIKSNRYEAWLKRGKSFLDKKHRSIGFQIGGIYYDQKTLFGLRNYDGTQKMLYSNLLYQTIIKNEQNKITIGSSFQAETSTENLSQQKFERTEVVPGIFGEYTYSIFEKFDLLLGLRFDHHNNYGLFVTPRIHARYAASQKTVFRASMGRGQRTASIIAENIGILASSRNIEIKAENGTNPYGLDAEVAWNYGVNLNHDFSDALQLSLDFYLTNFKNQIVVDYDQSPQKIVFYNLNGKSYSRSFQSQMDWNAFKGFDLRLAYRYNDVKTQFQEALLSKPMVSPHRAFANMAYEWKSFKFDYTINWQGSKRIPSTLTNPAEYQLAEKSDAFFISNVQVTKLFGKKFELYAGAENLFDFTQTKPIIAGGDAFGKYFDASLVWGPVFGRMIYAGFRYRILKEE